MIKKIFLIIITAFLFLTMVACGLFKETVSHGIQSTDTQTVIPTQTELLPISAPTTTGMHRLNMVETADVIIKALKDKDMTTLAGKVHPQWGLRFTPYSFIRDEDRLFSQQALAGLFEDETIYTWGAFDGTGEPIQMTFSQYFEQFVYSHDFASPEIIGVNKAIGQGNSINNISEYYSGCEFVEYHFSGFDPQYEGMDWESLRLVFREENGIYYLVGIIHAEWTI